MGGADLPQTRASVVIPTLNEAQHVAAAVAAARRRYSPAAVDIIVVDGGSTDRTLDEVPRGARVIVSGAGRARQLNRGAAESNGRILLFCHADTRLPERWLEAVEAALGQPRVSGGAFQPEFRPAFGGVRLLNLPNGLRYPARWWAMYGDQAQFARRADFEAVGGFPEIPLMEDLELARALARRGRLVRLPARVTTSSRRFADRGPLRQQALNTALVLRHVALGTPPDRLAARYHGGRCQPGGRRQPGREPARRRHAAR